MRYVFSVIAALAVATHAASPVQQETFISRVESGDVDGVTEMHPPFGRPPPTVDLSKYTIGQILNWTLEHSSEEEPPKRRFPLPWPAKKGRHTLPIHRIAWLVNRTDDKFKEALFDENAELTFLAPDDRALAPPRRRRGGPHDAVVEMEDDLRLDLGGPAQLDVYGDEKNPKPNPLHDILAAKGGDEDDGDDDGDDDKKEKRRRFFRKVLSIILRYHLVPDKAYTGRELGDAATLRTALPIARGEDQEHFRIRTRSYLFPQPFTSFNVYAYTRLQVKAKNGYIYLISAPLLPPLSPLNEAFLFPQLFSSLTTAVQKVELDDVLAPSLHHSKETDDTQVHPAVYSALHELLEERTAKEGPREFTVFAPTNFAFTKLGFKLNAFLFAPFPISRRILKKVLAYHVIPDATLFTDYIHNATEGDIKEVDYDRVEEIDYDNYEEDVEDGYKVEPDLELFAPHFQELYRGRANATTVVLNTLLPNATLGGKLVTYRTFGGKGPIQRDAYLYAGKGQKVKVFLTDLPARGGVIHVINTVLRPPFDHHGKEGHDLLDEL